MKKIYYFHGLLSTGNSRKGVAFSSWVHSNYSDVEVICPTLSVHPLKAVQQIQNLMKSEMIDAFVGSSMGGYQAAWAGQDLRIPSVLINPLVNAKALLKPYVGEIIHPETEERVVLTEDELAALVQREVPDKLTDPELILCLLQTGDEILDWSLAGRKFQLCHLRITEGGDHSYTNFEQDFAAMAKHMGLVA